ncbi:spore coat protein SP96-like [Palaemon carinicauda]|uniref:spore coat protein SP96-like n=1 Tax=Palaemon carinicauda TaxID=392227 RepID=UPI0035B649B5
MYESSIKRSVTCSFSNVAIDLASLSFSVNDHTFIYNVSQPTAGSTSLLGTEAYATPTSATSASGALTYATLASTTSASATSASATPASTSETSATNASTSQTSATDASASETSATNASTSQTSATNAFTSESTATNTNTTLALNATITPTSNSSITSNTTFITSASVNWTTSATTTPTVTNCNTKYWTVFSGSCYSQFSYMYKSWAEARGTCEYYSSSLVQITSPEELSFIANSFSSSASWIALKKDSTGTFRWDADNSESAISNWGTGEPGSGDCVNMSNGKWKTANCGNYLGFFCKKPAY